jgi:hypothetical protein
VRSKKESIKKLFLHSITNINIFWMENIPNRLAVIPESVSHKKIPEGEKLHRKTDVWIAYDNGIF